MDEINFIKDPNSATPSHEIHKSILFSESGKASEASPSLNKEKLFSDEEAVSYKGSGKSHPLSSDDIDIE